jgi:FHA domain
MVEQALLVARIAFVVLLYLFVWRVVRLSIRDVRAPAESLILSPEAVRAAGLDRMPDIPHSPAPLPGTVGHLLVRSSPVFPAGTIILLDSDVVFGRAAESDVPLAADGTVSGRHARVFKRDGSPYLEDLGSTNGTYVNGQPLAAERLLRPGDVVAVGATELVYEVAA